MVDGGDRVRAAVCDRAASYRRGLGLVLEEAGYDLREVDDLREDSVVQDLHVVLLTIRSASDWQVVRDTLVLNGEVKVVGLLVDPTPDRCAEALRCGAHAVVGWDASPERILTAVQAAIDGLTILETGTAQAMASTGPPLYDAEWVSREEIEWLRLQGSRHTAAH